MFEAKCPYCGSTSLNLYSTEVTTLEETGAIIVREGFCQDCYKSVGVRENYAVVGRESYLR